MEVLCVGGMGGLLCVRSQVPSPSPQVPVGRDAPRGRCQIRTKHSMRTLIPCPFPGRGLGPCSHASWGGPRTGATPRV